MNLPDALNATPVVKIGIDARSVMRTDRRGRTWFLISTRGQYLLVRQDKSGFKRVSKKFASQYADWRPQSDEDAAREAASLNSPEGWGIRNAIFGLVLGPLPEKPEVPDYLPVGVC